MDPRIAFALGVGTGILLAMLITIALTHAIVERYTDNGEEKEQGEGSSKEVEANSGRDDRRD